MINQSEQLLTIQQISLKLDIPKSTLRFWEKELDGFIMPIRTSGGQRRYSLINLSLIGKVKEFRDMGMSLAEIKSKLQADNQLVVKKPSLDNFERLAERVAELIKKEVYNFLYSQKLSNNADK
jgi:DNA-binding transcriptional MerR regulator